MPSPWDDLPDERPWVLPDDRPYVDAFNRHMKKNQDYVIDLDLFPEPCLGNRQAPVVVLNRNPGIGESDRLVHRRRDYIAPISPRIPKGIISSGCCLSFRTRPLLDG